MKKLTAFLVVITLFVLVTTAFAPPAITEDMRYIVTEFRNDYPCQSPKYEVHRRTVEGDRWGARWADGCKSDTTPQLSCPDGTVPLFDSLGPVTEGMTLSNGARIVEVRGNWIVSYQDNTLLVSGGRKMTVVFPADTYVIGLLVFDNDPKDGQEGWTLDGDSIPVTPRATWGALYSVESFERQLDFNNGDDSAHWNVCL